MRAPRMTISELKNSACAHLNQHLFQPAAKKKGKNEPKIGGRLVTKHWPKDSEEKNWI